MEIVEEGVPQGSTLSHFLFNVTVADLPDLYGRNYSLHQFADDIAILTKGYRNDSMAKLETNLQRIDNWLQKWRLQTNQSKTEVINLGKKSTIHDYVKFGHTNLKIKDYATYLGIVFQRRLRNRPRWTKHCNKRRNFARLTFKKLYPIMNRSSKLNIRN